MSVIEIRTQTFGEFFYKWIEEVHDKVCHITGEENPVYAVFQGHNTAYVYTTASACLSNKLWTPAGTARALPRSIAGDAMKGDEHDEYADTASVLELVPVYCNPPVDMSVTSFAEFDGVSSTEYAEYAMEEVTLGDILRHIKKRVSSPSTQEISGIDSDIKLMHTFVSLALPGSDTSVLMSFINHAMESRCYSFTMYPELPALKHTMLEVRSEMIRYNPYMYNVYKNRLLDTMLESVINDSRSKPEMEHRISGMIYELLFDSVVSCMGTMWCFTDGLWQECAYDGYIWKFMTNDFIDYLESKDAGNIALYMMSTVVRNRIMKDVKLRLQDDNFYRLLDSKRHIIRMTNGVYDTNSEKLLSPVPSDYVSVISGVPYQVFDAMSSEVGMLMSILGSILSQTPDITGLLHTFLLHPFSRATMPRRFFYIWWGTGNNAKTLVPDTP